MGFWLDRRADGSVALYIDGDLQFDTRDERIYHEALVLPALAVAEQRAAEGVRVLVCGGGDGLVARELLKSARVSAIDLVDYDPALVAFARENLWLLNARSFEDPRVTVTAANAIDFVAEAGATGRQFELIICDLTVPTDVESARLHSIEWYRSLAATLADGGIIAANGVSPTAAPRALAAMCNGMRAAGLQVAPFRVPIPSFAEAGYGPDWGFMLGGVRLPSEDELEALELAGPRQVLRHGVDAARLFGMPAELEVAAAQVPAVPGGSAELLSHLAAKGASAISSEFDTSAAPQWRTLQRPLLPGGERRRPLSAPGGAAAALEAATAIDEALRLLPGLHPGQTAEMIETFCAEPERFIEGIDLRTLVGRLLARAKELPKPFVRELRSLRRRLRNFRPGEGSVLELGSRVLAVVALVVILANLALPDSVYGKGATAGASSGASVSALAHPSVAGKAPVAPPVVASDSGFRSNFTSSGRTAVDESGTSYPRRSYYVYPSYYHGSHGYSNYRSGNKPDEQPKEVPGLYKLTSDTDILADGQVAVSVGDGSIYLLLGPEVTVLTDRATGTPLLYLAPNPTQLWIAAKEIERQTTGLGLTMKAKQRWIDWYDWLDFLPGVGDDRSELKNIGEMQARLQKARESLGTVADSRPAAATPPAPGAVELLSGVWIAKDGVIVYLSLPDGVAYLDGSNWYSDAAKTTKRTDAYPSTFKSALVNILAAEVRDESAIRSRLAAEQGLVQADLNELQSDLAAYNTPGADPNEMVDYGSGKVSRSEALRLTKEAIARSQAILTATTEELTTLPAEIAASKAALQMLAK